MPKTRAVICFSSNKETDYWHANSAAASLTAYQKVATNPSYQGRMP